jgi:hypothetical protein
MELTGDMWERRPDFDALFRDLLERIPRGEFFIRPDSHCSKCDYQTMCRRSHLPTRLRARDADGGAEEAE